MNKGVLENETFQPPQCSPYIYFYSSIKKDGDPKWAVLLYYSPNARKLQQV